MRSALALAAVTVTVAVLLSGCVPQGPEVTPPPEPSTAPIFASDEEALAAATEAYEAYLAMSDLIAQEGGANPERIAPYVTEEWLARELAGNKDLSEAGRRLVGNFEVSRATLQQVFDDANSVTIVAYMCVNPNGARVVDASGGEVTPEALKSQWTVEAEFVATNEDPLTLLLARNEPWSSHSSC